MGAGGSVAFLCFQHAKLMLDTHHGLFELGALRLDLGWRRQGGAFLQGHAGPWVGIAQRTQCLFRRLLELGAEVVAGFEVVQQLLHQLRVQAGGWNRGLGHREIFP